MKRKEQPSPNVNNAVKRRPYSRSLERLPNSIKALIFTFACRKPADWRCLAFLNKSWKSISHMPVVCRAGMRVVPARVTTTSLRGMVRSLTSLQQLDLSGCGQITDEGVSSLSSLTSLQQLDLSHCTQITDAGVSALTSLTSLQQLNLSNCKQITSEGVFSALSSLPALWVLNVSNCKDTPY